MNANYTAACRIESVRCQHRMGTRWTTPQLFLVSLLSHFCDSLLFGPEMRLYPAEVETHGTQQAQLVVEATKRTEHDQPFCNPLSPLALEPISHHSPGRPEAILIFGRVVLVLVAICCFSVNLCMRMCGLANEDWQAVVDCNRVLLCFFCFVFLSLSILSFVGSTPQARIPGP